MREQRVGRCMKAAPTLMSWSSAREDRSIMPMCWQRRIPSRYLRRTLTRRTRKEREMAAESANVRVTTPRGFQHPRKSREAQETTGGSGRNRSLSNKKSIRTADWVQKRRKIGREVSYRRLADNPSAALHRDAVNVDDWMKVIGVAERIIKFSGVIERRVMVLPGPLSARTLQIDGRLIYVARGIKKVGQSWTTLNNLAIVKLSIRYPRCKYHEILDISRNLDKDREKVTRSIDSLKIRRAVARDDEQESHQLR